MEPLLTSEDVAEYLRIDVVTVRRLVNRGELAAYRIGGEYRFAMPDIADYLKRLRVPEGGESMDDGFDMLTAPARKALSLAQQEATRVKRPAIDTEHLLLGLARANEGMAVRVLANMGVDLDRVRREVELTVGWGDRRSDRPINGRMWLTPQGQKVIELARDEARQLGQRDTGTEHLLLGLMREDEGVAAGVLSTLGVDLAKTRAEIVQILADRTTADPPAEQ